MDNARDEFEAFLAAQRADYARALPAKVAALEALWAAMGESAAGLKEFERAAHSIYGAAGTFGFHDVGAHAGTLETVAQEALEAGGGLTPEQAGRIAEALGALRLSLPAPP